MFEKVVEGVTYIPGRDRFLPDSHAYVVGKPDSDDISIVEAGLMGLGDYKLEQLDAMGISRKQVKRIILTHTHTDHIGALPEMLKELPHVEVWAHNDEALPLERGDSRIVWGNRMFADAVKAQFGVTDDYFNIQVQRKLVADETLDLGGLEFRVVHVPGHSCGSIALLNEEHKLLISGDTIYADGAIGRYDLASASGAELLTSLRLIATLGVDILLPSHNRIVTSGAEPMIANTVTQWTPLLGG